MKLKLSKESRHCGGTLRKYPDGFYLWNEGIMAHISHSQFPKFSAEPMTKEKTQKEKDIREEGSFIAPPQSCSWMRR